MEYRNVKILFLGCAVKCNQLNKEAGNQSWLPVSLCFQKRNVFVNGGSAYIAHSGKFTDIQMPGLIGRIVTEEDCWNTVLSCLRSADGSALFTSVRHARPHTLPYHG